MASNCICGEKTSSEFCDQCKLYPCDECGVVKPETRNSPTCNECNQKEEGRKDMIVEKYKDILSSTPTMEELAETVEEIDSCLLKNVSVGHIPEKVRRQCVYEEIVDCIKCMIEVRDFTEIETVLETGRWDDNSLTDTSPRDMIIEQIENRLSNVMC